MKLFLQNTKDAIEQLYGSEITKCFPNYAKFWEEFVGDPSKSVPVAYGLLFDLSIEAGERERINEIYEEICMSHYSLFCNLTGTHFQLENLKKALRLKNRKRKYFEHWEAFEVCYFHLGSVFYQMYHLWGLIFLLKGEVTRNKKGRFEPHIRPKLKNYLDNKEQSSLCKGIDQLEERITDLRDNIVHYSRQASEIHFGEFYIPMKTRKGKTWTTQHETDEWLETSRKIREDLEEIEKLINAIHSLLIEELSNFLKKSHIKVNRYGA